MLSNYYKETLTLYKCNILASSILLYKQVLHVTLTIAIRGFVYQLLVSLTTRKPSNLLFRDR